MKKNIFQISLTALVLVHLTNCTQTPQVASCSTSNTLFHALYDSIAQSNVTIFKDTTYMDLNTHEYTFISSQNQTI